MVLFIAGLTDLQSVAEDSDMTAETESLGMLSMAGILRTTFAPAITISDNVVINFLNVTTTLSRLAAGRLGESEHRRDGSSAVHN